MTYLGINLLVHGGLVFVRALHVEGVHEGFDGRTLKHNAMLLYKTIDISAIKVLGPLHKAICSEWPQNVYN